MTNNTAGSSNGRTPDFDSGNDGSSPSPASKVLEIILVVLVAALWLHSSYMYGRNVELAQCIQHIEDLR